MKLDKHQYTREEWRRIRHYKRLEKEQNRIQKHLATEQIKHNRNLAFIISQPKAGTYLCANLLKNFGMVATGMHVKSGKYRVYDITQPLPAFEKKNDLKKYIQSVTHQIGSFQSIIDLMPTDGFAVGHLGYEGKYIKPLRGVKKILLTRPHEQHKESIKRFQDEMYGDTAVTEEAYHDIECWRDEDDVFELTFNDLIKPKYAKLRKLQTFLFGEVKHDEVAAIHKALAAPSPTKSSIR
ncbi:MAG: hypothetical protein ACKVJK_02360 [Methylophagaceae bacterium]|jgi:hypothetical protein|tara:strand:- start:2924 stop:3637 length:714 start_codon:yes stop_codon:yes gene_type:complete